MTTETVVIDILYVEHMTTVKAAAAKSKGLSPVEIVVGRTPEGDYVAITHGGSNGILDYGTLNVVMKAREFGFDPTAAQMTVICCHPAQVKAVIGGKALTTFGDWKGATQVYVKLPQGGICNVSQFEVGEWMEVCAQPAN